jgi:uncharacterized protein (TIGR00725 family)
MKMKPMRITIFGGSKTVAGEPAYEEARQLGKLLGGAGHTVLTGGYIGTMEAVSRGAAEAGGHVIGVTCSEIEAWRPGGPNRWVIEEMRFPSTRERLLALIDNCEAAFALPGGAGTLAEITMMWNNLITNSIEPKPLILIGPGWKKTFDAFYTALSDYIPERDRKWLTFVPNIEEAVKLLERIKGAGSLGDSPE